MESSDSPIPPESPAANIALKAVAAAQSDHPRRFEAFRYAYPVVSRRSGGLSIGVNLNLDKNCNFACPYCQVDRTVPGLPQSLSPDTIEVELRELLETCAPDGQCRLDRFAHLPQPWRMLRDVALSGDGEPTLVREFEAVCHRLAGLQAEPSMPRFKLVLITNATQLHQNHVQRGLEALCRTDGEIWAKLDAGTEAWYQRVNVSRTSLERVEHNILDTGRRFPMKLQSCFLRIGGEAPDAGEIDAYLDRLKRLRAGGAGILEVQLYTLARRPAEAEAKPIETAFLQSLRRRIEEEASLPARVYATEGS